MSGLLSTLFWRPGGFRRCRAASEEVPGGQGKPGSPERWPESPGRGLARTFYLNHFSVKAVRFLCSWVSPGVSRRCRAASQEVPGGQGKPRAHERWPESSGRGLDDDFLIEALSCQDWSFAVLLGRYQVAPGGIELGPRRSQEGRGSPELQNGSLRALEEA